MSGNGFKMEGAESDNLIDKYKLPVIVGVVGLVLLVGGIISSGIIPKTFVKSTKVLPVPVQTSTGEVSGVKKTTEMKVDVSGAVVSPGVYSLSPDSRIEDAIKSAGGVLTSANSDYLAKNINLAQKVVDGMKIYVPSGSEVVPIQTSSTQTSVNPTQPALININTATLVELDKLSGIGAVTAQKIIDNRPYSGIEELVTKKAVYRSVYEKIKGMISI